MRNIIFILSLLFFCNIYAQETNKILYSTNCNQSDKDTQKISFRLEDNSLFITGEIFANCCGKQYLQYEIFPDSIYLSRVDDGALCACYCLHDINIKIENCPANFYKIKLASYLGDEIESIVYSNFTSLSEQNTQNNPAYYPNPVTDYLTVKLPTPDFNKLIVYDVSGKVMKTINCFGKENVSINTKGWTKGIYLCLLFHSDGHILTEKVIKL